MMKKFMLSNLSRLFTMGVAMVSATALWGNESLESTGSQKQSVTQEAVEIASVNEGLLNSLGEYFKIIARPAVVEVIASALPKPETKGMLLKGVIPLPQPFIELENTFCKELRRLFAEIYSKEELQGIYDFCRQPQAMSILQKLHQLENWDDIRYGICLGNIEAQESELTAARHCIGSIGEKLMGSHIISIEPIITHFVNIKAMEKTSKGAARVTENNPWNGIFQDAEWNWVVKSAMPSDATAAVSALGGSAQVLNLAFTLNGLSGFHMTDLDPAVWQKERICHHAMINRYHRITEICGDFFPQYQEFALKYREKAQVLTAQFAQSAQKLYLAFFMKSLMGMR